MTADQARNTVAILQKLPFYYRNFGVWWWHIKRQLKRFYDQAQLQHLGDYTDPECEQYYEGMTVAQLDDEAFQYQYDHTFASYNLNVCATPDGEVYVIHDQDAE